MTEKKKSSMDAVFREYPRYAFFYYFIIFIFVILLVDSL